MNRKNTLFQQRGFTLTELMIAVAIIGILAAFLTPSVSRYMHRNKGTSAANAVAGELRAARNHAMSTGQVVFVDIGLGGDHGSFTMYQNQPNGCDQPNPPAACFSQSCAEASRFPSANEMKIPSPRADFAKHHPAMKISGHNTLGDAKDEINALKLCFAPDGRVLNELGTPFKASCDGINARIFVQPTEPGTFDNPLGSGSGTLDKCWGVEADSGNMNFRQTLKDGRDVANFFVIQIPYNGAISVVQ